ncbi:MAG TPA: hypothetical protein VN541_22560 [Tepidisphaeraceae bacterium]|nr:hypothetical protein [Tepidisphaeraceae bacterium]
MSRMRSLLTVLVLAGSLLLAQTAFARQPKKYQVTGTVLEVTKDYIAVDKAGERWEIGRDASTKITGTLKVGAKVTVEYRMSATNVDVTSKGSGK